MRVLRKIGIILLFVIGCLVGLQQPAQAAGNDQFIIINKANNKLAFFDNWKLVKVFDVATGRKDSYTPEGRFRIVNKIKNRPYYTKNIPGGDPRNPLGDRWLGLDARGTYGTTYAIHGNSNESSIGRYVSSGCVRMHNSEVRWLFSQVELYTTVVITNSSSSFEELAVKHNYLSPDVLNKVNAQKAGNALLNELSNYQAAMNAGSVSNMNSLYDRFTKQLRATEIAIGKVSGKSNRDQLEATYVRPAKVAVERSIYEISQYRLLKTVEEHLSKNKLTHAENEIAKLAGLKRRAVAIKNAGNYEALNPKIGRSLQSLEATVQGTITQISLTHFNRAIGSANIANVNNLYDSFTRKIRTTEVAIGQVYGSANRKALNDQYITPAKIAVERTIYEVSIYRLLLKIDVLISSNKIDQAKSELSKLDRLKRRAIEIKQAGGYQSLPSRISSDLNKLEENLRAKL